MIKSVVAPPVWEDADVYALKALQAGTANGDQQKRALDWIITKAAGAYDLSFRSGDQHDTSFAEGRRSVGLQVIKLVNLDISAVKQAERALSARKQSR